MSVSLTPSQKFMVFWLSLIIGVGIGSLTTISSLMIGYLTAIWFFIFLSGQDEPIENLAIILTAGLLGILIWQLTDGESWLKLKVFEQLSGALLSWRDRLIEQIFLILPEPHGSLLSGILFGNRVKLDRELVNQFRLIGLSHLIAVSGYNLTVLITNLQALLKPLIGRRSLWACSAVTLGFILISGAPASILRAGVMAGIILVGHYLGRPVRSVNILVLAAGVLVIFEPKIVFEIGFQLSVAATYGLLRLAPLLDLQLSRLVVLRSVRVVLAETLAATLATAPLLIGHFERLSTISPLTNILVLPLIPLLMGLGLIGVIGLLVLPSLGQILILLTWPILQWIVSLTQTTARLSYASTNLELNLWLIVALMIGLLGGFEYLNYRFKSALNSRDDGL